MEGGVMPLNKNIMVIVGLTVFVCFYAVQAYFYPERIYKERTKYKLNTGWKFIKNNPSGDPSQAAFNDAAWQTVNIPHSASYDAPTASAEKAGFIGTCWYRLHFKAPATAKHTAKKFLVFDGAMQTADVWLNGKKIGASSVSGYTWFYFDVSGAITDGDNILAVKLDNNYSSSIPPGRLGNTSGPDFFLFSGLYRNVWLVCTDKCFIPQYGQQISVAKGPYPNGAPVRIKTTIRNEYSSAKNVMLRYVVANNEKDAQDKIILIDSIKLSVGSNQSRILDKTCTIPASAVTLWSLDNPYLYRVFTQVFIDGVLADDYVDRFGVRWANWDVTDKFSLNGQKIFIQGTSAHQFYPWIQNATPASRFFKDMQLNKEMGINMVRCAHYPRDPSFYDACDEVGLLLFVEIPTWGNLATTYPDIFWNRCDTAMQRMIEVGFNHPSIIGWGLFNEPAGDFCDSVKQLGHLNILAHQMDSSGRVTYTANNKFFAKSVTIPDILGLNYAVNCPVKTTKPLMLINAEYHVGWTLDFAFRGDAKDVPTNIAANFWRDWTAIVNASKNNSLSGGTMWCFADYYSMMNEKPMGVVDVYRIPKSTYYLYRKNWMNTPDDNPVKGLAPAKLQLDADTNRISADSVDVFLAYASIRDASGKCVHTGYESSCNTTVTFTVKGPADVFGPLTVKANGGKCAFLIKSKNTPGEIKISATTNTGLKSGEVMVRSVATEISPLEFLSGTTTVRNGVEVPSAMHFSIRQSANDLKIIYSASITASMATVALINMKGQKMAIRATKKQNIVTINTERLTPGSYFIMLGRQSQDARCMKKILIAR